MKSEKEKPIGKQLKIKVTETAKQVIENRKILIGSRSDMELITLKNHVPLWKLQNQVNSY